MPLIHCSGSATNLGMLPQGSHTLHFGFSALSHLVSPSPQCHTALPPESHLSLSTAVLLCLPNEICFSLQVLVKFPQGHVSFLHEDVWHVGLCTHKINTAQQFPGCEGHPRGCGLGEISSLRWVFGRFLIGKESGISECVKE